MDHYGLGGAFSFLLFSLPLLSLDGLGSRNKRQLSYVIPRVLDLVTAGKNQSFGKLTSLPVKGEWFCLFL